MRFAIRHELKNRLRIHFCVRRFSFREADILEYYLRSFDEIKEVCIYERTADAVVRFEGDRSSIISIVRDFSFEDTKVPERVYESSGRELS